MAGLMSTDKLQRGQVKLLEQIMRVSEEIKELKQLIFTIQKIDYRRQLD
jgi:hypothetical protein